MAEKSTPTENTGEKQPTTVTLDDQTLEKVIDGVVAKMKEAQKGVKPGSSSGTALENGKLNSQELPLSYPISTKLGCDPPWVGSGGYKSRSLKLKLSMSKSMAEHCTKSKASHKKSLQEVTAGSALHEHMTKQSKCRPKHDQTRPALSITKQNKCMAAGQLKHNQVAGQ